MALKRLLQFTAKVGHFPFTDLDDINKNEKFVNLTKVVRVRYQASRSSHPFIKFEVVTSIFSQSSLFAVKVTPFSPISFVKIEK